ncbi:MAG: hypothetical protein PHW34_01960 [Hespellia sp.]|nr:hypothetical protein [Hespellia sp.]
MDKRKCGKIYRRIMKNSQAALNSSEENDLVAYPNIDAFMQAFGHLPNDELVLFRFYADLMDAGDIRMQYERYTKFIEEQRSEMET